MKMLVAQSAMLISSQHNQLLSKCRILNGQMSNYIELSGKPIADHLDQKQHQ
jgi:hypothetical protein